MQWKVGLPATVDPRFYPPQTVTVTINNSNKCRIYVCARVCTHAYTLICFLYTHTPMYVHTHTPIYIQSTFYKQTHMYVCIFT